MCALFREHLLSTPRLHNRTSPEYEYVAGRACARPVDRTMLCAKMRRSVPLGSPEHSEVRSFASRALLSSIVLVYRPTTHVVHNSGRDPAFGIKYDVKIALCAQARLPPRLCSVLAGAAPIYKGWNRAKKIALIETEKPTWEDLAEHWYDDVPSFFGLRKAGPSLRSG